MADDSLTETKDADRSQPTCWADMSDDEEIALPATAAPALPSQSAMLRAQQAGMLNQQKLSGGRGGGLPNRPLSACSKGGRAGERSAELAIAGGVRGDSHGGSRRMYAPLSRHQSTKSIDYMEDMGRPYRVAVGNLVPDVTQEQLVDLFRPITVLSIEFGSAPGRSTTSQTAFVTFETFQDQRRAIREIDGRKHRGRALHVSMPRQRDCPRPTVAFQSGLLAVPSRSQQQSASKPSTQIPTQPAPKPRRRFNIAALNETTRSATEPEQRNVNIFGVGKPREEVLAEKEESTVKVTDSVPQPTDPAAEIPVSLRVSNNPPAPVVTAAPTPATEPPPPAAQSDIPTMVSLQASAIRPLRQPLAEQQSTPSQPAPLPEPEPVREPVPAAKNQPATQQPQAPPQLQQQQQRATPTQAPSPMLAQGALQPPKVMSPPLLPDRPLSQRVSPAQSPGQLMQPRPIMQPPCPIIEGPPANEAQLQMPDYYMQTPSGPQPVYNNLYWQQPVSNMLPPQAAQYMSRPGPTPPLSAFPYQGMFPQPGIQGFIPRPMDSIRGIDLQAPMMPPPNLVTMQPQGYASRFRAEPQWADAPPQQQQLSSIQIPPTMRLPPENLPSSELIAAPPVPVRSDIPPPPVTSPAVSPAQVCMRSPVIAPSIPVAAPQPPMAPALVPAPTAPVSAPAARVTDVTGSWQQPQQPRGSAPSVGAAQIQSPPQQVQHQTHPPVSTTEESSGRRVRQITYASVTKGTASASQQPRPSQPPANSEGPGVAASGQVPKPSINGQQPHRGGQQRRGNSRWGRQSSSGWQNNRKGSTGSNSRRRGMADTTHTVNTSNVVSKPTANRTNHSDSCSTDDFETFAKINKRR